MALVSKLSHINTNSTGTRITIANTTGNYSEDNKGGFGDPNPAFIKAFIFEISHIGCSAKLRIKQSYDFPNAALPPMGDIMIGKPIVIDSYSLGASEGNTQLSTITDGVVEIIMHTVIDSPIDVSGDECQYTLTGVGFDALTSFEYVLIGTHLYSINKSQPTNNGTILYLNEPLKESATQIYPVDTTSLKVLVDADTNKALLNKIADLANPHNISTCGNDKLINVMKLFVGKYSAQVAFDKKDYHKAADLLSISKNL